ncbi:MAG: polysaccharide pyruvyl transferase CsaB [Bacillota bacterium]
MGKVVISGYYGFNNVGDESILTAIVQNLKDSIANIDITVLSVNPVSTAQKHQVHAIDRKNIFQIIRAIWDGELLISGGGSLLQDVTSHRSISYYLGIMMIGKLLKKKVMVYSQGIGPINRTLNKYLVRWVLNKVDVITVRDEKSKKELIEIGVRNPEIYVTADPVIGLKKGNLALGEGILQKEGMTEKGKHLIGFAIRGWRCSDKFKKDMAAIADGLIDDLGVEVVFIPFHFGEDVKILDEIQDLMKNKGIFIKNRYDIHEMLGIVGNLDLLIGVRLHSLIFAAVMNTPMIALSYDPKINSFMDSLNMETLCHIEDIVWQDLLDEVKTKWHEREKLKKALSSRVAELCSKLQINENIVSRLLQ